ncbi:hypothetical protein Vau01_044210 [Virgisporangium aurantiacum]|uniref:Uncharacterized protein n=1 Tax=Virgisporangium aurantiacum TaxID=175570 RepID=A0A8J4DZN0_9ACTN|nr:hypothetical protein Vau01_044210 [Virgisporangium aurantiacum]
MQHRQVAIEHDHVVTGDAGALQGGITVESDIDGHTLPPQNHGHGVGQFDVILDQQHPHDRTVFQIAGYNEVTKWITVTSPVPVYKPQT